MKMPKLEPIPYDNTVNFLTFTRKWKLIEDWYYTLPNGRSIIIEKGFIFDGASIPRIFRNILSPVGILLIPGLVHDFAYKYNYLIEIYKEEKYLYYELENQKFWDKLFYEIALKVTKKKFISKFTYYSLKFFGFIAYNSYRR